MHSVPRGLRPSFRSPERSKGAAFIVVNDNWTHAGTGVYFSGPEKYQKGIFVGVIVAECAVKLDVAVRSRAARQAAPAVRCAHSEKPRISPWKSKLFPGNPGLFLCTGAG